MFLASMSVLIAYKSRAKKIRPSDNINKDLSTPAVVIN